ncbi:hypothetical protein FJK74_03105 [Escherichia coli]|nr:hypothetical protein [Escherichia coli]
MTSLKTSIKTITYLSDTGCLEIQGASLDVIYSTSVCHILAVRKSTLLPIDTIIRHQVSDIS